MFPKQYRFSSRIEGEFFRTAKRIYSPLFILYIKNNNLDHSRGAVIVPKKVVSKSTRRSEIKRQMRIALLTGLQEKTGLDLVLYLKSVKKDLTREIISSEVDSLLNKI